MKQEKGGGPSLAWSRTHVRYNEEMSSVKGDLLVIVATMIVVIVVVAVRSIVAEPAAYLTGWMVHCVYVDIG